MMAGTLAETLRVAARTLDPCSESPRLDAELLLAKVLDLSRSALIVRGEDTMPPAIRREYDGLLALRCAGVPIAYLTGHREFWSLTLHVTPAVLVPRPETELLVEQALRLLPLDRPCSLLDLGTGSGAIALAVAGDRPRCRVIGVDVSPGALAVARQNSQELGLAQIDWRLGNWFGAVPGERFDVIVANPPYVAAADPALAALRAEPLLALSPGPTGMEALETIIAHAAAHLNDSGSLLLEHGSAQGGDVAALLARSGFACVHCFTDTAGLPRVTSATIHNTRNAHDSFRNLPG